MGAAFSRHDVLRPTTQRLGIEATDDPEIKARMAEDPLILRHARVDTLHGVTQAMDDALAAAHELPVRR
ncbi:hypothetical protein DSL92_04610 [Billgrantia gudaonensis]|uniref:Uncharacterized protein n=1 Tax=Billgrantia gudaonensis TaxID=376427 RepID=A0A432JK32_9GAMM|nr:hypothetical protein DSL92_04610 [Halomonas gudaonensis]